MTTESIQYGGQIDRQLLSARRDRWTHMAEMFGIPLSAGQLDELPNLSDRDAARRFFPQLADVELDEVLWAARLDDVVESTCSAAA